MKIGDIVYIPDCSRIIEMKIVKAIALGVEPHNKKYVLEGEYTFDERGSELRYKLSEKKTATYSFYVVDAYCDKVNELYMSKR